MKKIIKNTLGVFLCLSLLFSSWAQADCVNFYSIPTLELMATGDTAMFPPESATTRNIAYGISTLVVLTPFLLKILAFIPNLIALPPAIAMGTMGYFDFKNKKIIFYIPQQGKIAVTVQEDSTQEKLELAKAGLEIFSEAYGHHVYPLYPNKNNPLKVNEEFLELTRTVKAEANRENLFVTDHDIKFAIREVNERSTICSDLEVRKVVDTKRRDGFVIEETSSFDYKDIVEEVIRVAIKRAQGGA